MTRLKQVDASGLIRALKRDGFVEIVRHGSHVYLHHPIRNKRTVVPFHGGDVNRGLLKRILKQAGFSEDEFRKLL